MPHLAKNEFYKPSIALLRFYAILVLQRAHFNAEHDKASRFTYEIVAFAFKNVAIRFRKLKQNLQVKTVRN